MKKWKWFGNAGHFICSRDCHFHICTQVGKYLISTVGELWPDRCVREINARFIDPDWHAENNHLIGDDYDVAYFKRFGFDKIGSNRTYETMVFKAGKPCDMEKCKCGIPSLASEELDSLSYNDAASATRGHMKLCEKWSRIGKQ